MATDQSANGDPADRDEKSSENGQEVANDQFGDDLGIDDNSAQEG